MMPPDSCFQHGVNYFAKITLSKLKSILRRSVMKEEKMKSNLDVKASVNDSAARAAEDDFM